jgi:hypothetical protein
MNDGSIYMHEERLHSGRDLRSATAGAGGLMRFDELKHVPVVAPIKLFIRRSAPKHESAQRAAVVTEIARKHAAHGMRRAWMPRPRQERTVQGSPA